MPDQTRAPTAAFQRKEQSSSIDPNQFRRFRQTALLLLAAAIFAIAFYTILGLATGVWQITAEAGLIILGLVCLAIGYREAKRGQFDRAGHLVLFGLALVYGGPELLWSGATVYLAVGGLILIFLAGDLLLPHRPQSWFIAAGLFSAFLWLADQVNLWPRFDYSQSPFLNLFVPFITLALAAVLLWQVARAYLNYSLRTKLIIAFLAVSLVSVGAIAFYADRTVRLALQDRISFELTNVAQQQGATIGDLLAKEVQLLRTASLNETIRSQATTSNASYQGSPADIQAAILVLDHEWIAAAEANDDTNPLIRSRLDNPIAEYLREYRTLHPENVEVFVTDRYGALLGATNLTSDYYQADEAWWQAAFNNGNGAIYYAQPDYDASSSTYSIDIAFPLYDRDGKTIIGVMRTTVDLATILTLLTNVHVGQTGHVEMLLPNNEFVEAQGPKDVPPELLAQLPAPLAGTSEVDWEGTSSFAAVAPVNSADPELGSTIGQLNWQIIAHQSSAEVLAPVDAQTRTVLLVIAVVAVIVVGASVGLSQVLVRPIAHLTTVATQVSKGDLTTQAEVETGDEVGALAVTFNNMTAQLRSLVGSLEDRVQARTEQLRTSADVGRAAASTLDPDQLLREVVNLITDRFGFYYAAVFTFDAAGKFAVLREATGEAGRILKERHHQLEVGGQSMVGYVTAQRKARIALDVGEEAVRFANPLLRDTRSEIALPLVAGDRVLGALDVQSTQEAAFDEASAAVLQAMADQIAIALNNAKQFQQTERQVQLQAEITQLGRSLFAALNAEELYRALTAALGGIVAHDYLSLTLIQGEGTVLREYQLRANTEEVITEGPLRSITNTLSGRAFTTCEPAVSLDFAQGVPALEDLAQLERLGFRSAMSLPLIAGEHVLGTLNFASHEPAAYSTQDTVLLEQIAGQVAVALENLRLAQAQQRSLRELESLTRQLTGQAWAKQIQQLPEQVKYKQYTQSGIGNRLPTVLPEIDLAMRTQQPVAWTQTDDQPVPTPYKATLATPIILRGEVLGALQVGEASQLRTWSDDDIAFIQAIADQVALALDNARLIEQAEQRVRRERVIAEVGSRLFAANDLQNILQIASEELGHTLGVARAEVKIGSEFLGLSSETTPADQGDGHAAAVATPGPDNADG